MSNTNQYKHAKSNWDGSLGRAIRCLLTLKDEPGSWLWFHDTIKAYGITLHSTDAGTVVRAMLIYKLQQYATND